MCQDDIPRELKETHMHKSHRQTKHIRNYDKVENRFFPYIDYPTDYQAISCREGFSKAKNSFLACL